MNPTSGQSIRLFQLFGITVRLHWMWFLVAAYEFSQGARSYSSPIFNALEYLSLFLIVLLHEFGHALACRSVGGRAEEIILWPLGGVAYVSPPPRPGALLWSIAAGPLVNVMLIPVIFFTGYGLGALDLPGVPDDVYRLIAHLRLINYALLIFNLLPIYPLDGGQILRSLLWFPLGRGRSLRVASILGLVGAAGIVFLAIKTQSLWTGVIAFYMVTRCWSAFKQAGALALVQKAGRRAGFACPACHEPPPNGDWWGCSACGVKFDFFATGGTCPNCRTPHSIVFCLECGQRSPLGDWKTPGA